MQEPHEKGIAIHSAPSFALGAVRFPVKRKQGKRWAGYRASKICNQGADAVTTVSVWRTALRLTGEIEDVGLMSGLNGAGEGFPVVR